MQHALAAVLATPDGSLNYVFDCGDESCHDFGLLATLNSDKFLGLANCS